MSKADDYDRLEELKLKIFGQVARQLLNGNKTPYVVSSNEIEPHGGRVKKAVRLLKEAGVIVYKGRTASRYNSEDTYKVLTFDRDSASYKQEPRFKTHWTQHLNETTQTYSYRGYGTSCDRGGVTSQEEADTIGFRRTGNLSSGEALYVYHHRDDFSISIIQETANVYPNAGLEELRRQILKSVVETRFQDHFQEKLTAYLGLPEESFKREESTNMSHRQFSYHAVAFTPEHYEGFIEEYTHYKTYFEAMLHQVHKTLDLIKEKGGHAEIVKEMRIAAIQEILEEIPLYIAQKHDTREYGYESEIHISCLYRYILRNSEFMDYEYLYGDDTSIVHISGYGALPDKMEEYSLDIPEDEKKLVESYKKEQKECLKKSLSELCTSISRSA